MTDAIREQIMAIRDSGLTNMFDIKTVQRLAYDTGAFPGAPIWCAQWDDECDCPGTAIWQYTDELEIGGRVFDGNICLAEVL